ncbi:uncharacterized protein LOC116957493 isoform X1 [Petromyzon marinus]|uniref:uncharacterized protein LOC116957493 isoform X1 n=2 Tax=Petromyzon marinus TaxID=7757 RepID=UPI003F6FA67B
MDMRAIVLITSLVAFTALYVQAYNVIRENVAQYGVATQSSTYPYRIANASLAIDGNMSSSTEICTSTIFEAHPWWSLDLKVKMPVYAVTITFRGNYLYQFTNQCQLLLGNLSDSSAADNIFCQTLSNAKMNTTTTYNCSGQAARFIHIVSKVDNFLYLQLCEIQVSTIPLQPNNGPVIYGSAQQSSNANTRSVASLVLDSSDNVNFCLGSCSQTAKEWEPWLRLQLDRPYMVSSVGIVNRNDTQGLRLFGAEIRVGNSKANGGKGNALCAEDIFVPLGRSRDYPCPFLKGRFVSIIIPGRVDSLSLCEVKVNLNTYAINFNILY